MRTSLQKRYEQLVRSGLIKPLAEVPRRFTYPSVLTVVPTFTTYGVADTRGLNEDQIAQLERNTK